MRCNNRKNTCAGNIVSSICTKYMGYLPEYSILNQECASIEETTEELYKNQEKILESIDLSELGNDCISYQKQGEKLKVNEVLYALESEICDIKDKITENVFKEMHLDFKGLTDQCGNNISSLKIFFQTLINEIDNLKNN